METAANKFSFDNRIGRKLPAMFLGTGFVDVKVNFIPDRAFGGFGGDPEKKWNWEVQLQNAIGFNEKVFGSLACAKLFAESFIERFNRQDVYVFCTLFYVEGRKP